MLNSCTYQPVSLLLKLFNFISFTSFVSFSLLSMTNVPFFSFSDFKTQTHSEYCCYLTCYYLCSLFSMFYFMCLQTLDTIQYILLASQYLTLFSFHVKYLGFHVRILHRMKQNSIMKLSHMKPKLPSLMISVINLLWSSVLYLPHVLNKCWQYCMAVIINMLVFSTLKKKCIYAWENYIFCIKIKAKVTNWKCVLKKLLW
jgi:hypothetical protein